MIDTLETKRQKVDKLKRELDAEAQARSDAEAALRQLYDERADHLKRRRALAELAEKDPDNGNARLAVEQYIQHRGATVGDSFALARFTNLASGLANLAAVQGALPAMRQENEAALESLQAKILKTAEASNIDLAAFGKALREGRECHEFYPDF